MGVLPVQARIKDDERRMRHALDIARQTPEGDVPVGAVIYAPTGRSWRPQRTVEKQTAIPRPTPKLLLYDEPPAVFPTAGG